MTIPSYVQDGFRGLCGDKRQYFSATPDLASVKAVIAHAARWAKREDMVVVVFDVRWAYFYAEEKRDTFVEFPDYVPAEFTRWKVAQGVVRDSSSCSIVGGRAEEGALQLLPHR